MSTGTRDGLVTPCNDLVGIIEEAEVLFRKAVFRSKLVLRNIPTDNICFATLESPTVKSLWDNIVTASGNPTSPTSKLCLESIVKLYLKIEVFLLCQRLCNCKIQDHRKTSEKRALRKDMKQSSDE